MVAKRGVWRLLQLCEGVEEAIDVRVDILANGWLHQCLRGKLN